MERLVLTHWNAQPGDPKISFNITDGSLYYLMVAAHESPQRIIGLTFWHHGFRSPVGILTWPHWTYHGRTILWNIRHES